MVERHKDLFEASPPNLNASFTHPHTALVETAERSEARPEVYAMARISKVPRKATCRTRRTAQLPLSRRKVLPIRRSQLDAIPEQDERTFWSPLRQTRYMVD
ncbi:hypothetical protein MSG28_000071 [Choristoneura fumiferana]|uniref:Uncharacterized protein n=1 Tax=Choristoneura fumiferana TaxID=7141 RepID=A0ACC0JZK4_CHOFU|nr:hypothetical protein MSG28_000071 [Choristoneura fumiferana]